MSTKRAKGRRWMPWSGEKDEPQLMNIFFSPLHSFLHSYLGRGPNCEQNKMEVERKLQEQIEVQRHLQLRIEAQGKYLQAVLRKAQEALAKYISSTTTLGVEEEEHTKLELSEMSSISNTGFIQGDEQHAECSTDSCLTSSERREANINGLYDLNDEFGETSEACWRGRSKVGKRGCSSVYEDAAIIEQQQSKDVKRFCCYEEEKELDLNA